MQMIIRHPRHPSHLCQDPDSISQTFLEQFVLVARTSLLDIINSYTSFFSVGVDSGSPYQLLYSWICLAAVGRGGGGGVGRRRKAGGIIQQTNNRSAPTCFLIRLPTMVREPRKSIMAAILPFERGLVDRGESISTLGLLSCRNICWTVKNPPL